MNQLAAIDRAVSGVIQKGRIGRVAAVRLVLSVADQQDAVEKNLAVALQSASRWIGDDCRRITAMGDRSRGGISAIVEFASGQTALVSVHAAAEESAPLTEALVVGTRGVMSWEPAVEFWSDVCDESGTGVLQNVSPADPARTQWLDAVFASLERRCPVALDGSEIAGSRRLIVEPPPFQEKNPGRFSPANPPFGVLLIAGNQTHQENYARALAADSRCRLIGLTDEAEILQRRNNLNAALAEELGVPVLEDIEAALRREDVDIVSVCAEPERRAKIILRAAASGKHLYLDKPLCATPEEADDIVRAVASAGVVSQMFSQVRTSAGERVRRLVESKAVGELHTIHFDMLFAKGVPGTASMKSPRKESARPERFEAIESKREFNNVGIYPLTQLVRLVRRPVRRVYATTGNYFFEEHERNDMEDFGAMLLEFDDGLVASVLAGRSGWRTHPGGGLNRTVLAGDERMATVDAARPRVEVWAEEPPWTPPSRNPEDPMGFWSSTCAESGLEPRTAWSTPATDAPNDFEYFLDCVEHGRQSDVSAAVAAAATKLVFAAYESAAAGAMIETQ